MCKANQNALDSKQVSPEDIKRNPHALDGQKNAFHIMEIVYFAVALVIMGVVSQIGINILEKVSDKTALVNGDTFMNASNDSVDAVETGFDFQEILILGIIASAIFSMFLGFIKF